MKKGVQHINCNIFGCDLEETRFNFSWGPQAVRGSSESCGPLNHCSHELVGGGGVGWPLLAVRLIIWATLRWVTNESWWNCLLNPSRQLSQLSRDDYLVILLVGCRRSNFKESIIFADLDKGWSNPRKFPIFEYLCRSWKLWPATFFLVSFINYVQRMWVKILLNLLL